MPTLNILQQNLRRSRQAVNEILDSADKRTNNIANCSILLVQEPAVDTSSSNIVGFPSYATIIADTIEIPKAAIVILSPDVHFTALPFYTNSFCSTVKIHHPIFDFILTSIYFTPNTSITHMMDHLRKILEDFSDIPVLLCGDFNCVHSRWFCRRDTTRGRRLLEFIDDSNCSIFTTPSPTYSHFDGRNSFIDLLLANPQAVSIVSEWKQLPFGVYSDHTPQLLSVGHQEDNEQPPRQQTSTWRFREKGVDWKLFTNSFDSEALEAICMSSRLCSTTSDIDRCIATLSSTILDAAYSTLPLKKQTFLPSGFTRRVWWDRTVDALHKDVQRYKNRVRRATNPVVREAVLFRYLRLKEELEGLSKAKSTASWMEYVCDGDKSEAKDWGNAYRFIQLKWKGRTPKVKFFEGEQTEVADNARSLLQKFFPSSAETACSRRHDSQSTFTHPPLTLSNICSIVRKLSTKKAPGIDHISNTIIKHLPKKALLTLQNVYSKCLSTGYFPTAWKVSAVRIIPKPNKSDYTLASSYRPISLTSHLSKILEKVINYHLTHFLESRDFIHPHQYGFRAGRSTADALQRIITLAEPAKGKRKAIVSFDFRSAFDFAPHSLIVQSLADLNTPSFLIEIISSYLNNRKAVIKLSDMEIEHLPTGRGCPQGGILSPILWSVVVNTLLMELDAFGFQPTAYADDLTVVCAEANDNALSSSINEVALIVKDWSTRTGIPINLDKSNALPVGHRSIPTLALFDLQVVHSTKILGITFVSNLKFDKHVSTKLTMASRYLDIMNRHFRRDFGLTCERKRTLYSCYVKPMLLYASEVWGERITKKTLAALNTFENTALRNAVHGFKSTSSDAMHVLTATPFIKDLISERGKAFKCRKHLAPHFPNNPLLNRITVLKEESNIDSDLVMTIDCNSGSEKRVCSIFITGLSTNVHFFTRYALRTATHDAIANSIRKALKLVLREQPSTSSILVQTHSPNCLKADGVRVTKNANKVFTYLEMMNAHLYVKFRPPAMTPFPQVDLIKVSYQYASYQTIKEELSRNLQLLLQTAATRCRSGVQTLVKHRLYHHRLLNQATTTFITEHGPTRSYLMDRQVTTSSLCPACLVPETYTHVALFCPRFQRLHIDFDTSSCTDINMLIAYLLDRNIFSEFCQRLYSDLRAFNSSL